MDPSSFTQTSFCDIKIDNITQNESKEYILNQLSLLTGIKYDSRYAKVFNEQFSSNLKNPHIFCLKSSGTPYLLFLSQVNGINYSFLIDKKVKDGYDYPKIFIVPYDFSADMFKGTLFECELIRARDKSWSLSINDIYCSEGRNHSKTIVLDRLNIIHTLLENSYAESEFTQTCPLFVKKYFDFKDMHVALEEFAPKLPYDTRGIYFVPLRCDYSKILYIMNDAKNNAKNNQMKDKNRKAKSQAQSQDKAQSQAKENVNDHKTSDIRCFRIMKTMKPDVYELYLSDTGNLSKHSIALVQSTEASHTLLSYFKAGKYDTEILVNCSYNEVFNKWEPLSLSNGPITEVV